jgi:hypothetical protein
MKIKNQNLVDEPVQVTKEESPFNGFNYSHPSYGRAVFHRTSGSDRPLYGSDLKHGNTIQFTLESSSCRQDLGRNWFGGGDMIAEVEFSQIQFAELLTNMNTEGVPCTIRYRADMGRINFAEMSKAIDYVEDKIDKLVNSQASDLKRTKAEIDEILERKGTMKKADKDRVQKLSSILVGLSQRSLPFYADSAIEIIGRSKAEAKASIEAHQQHLITTLGVAALQDKEVINKLLGDKLENKGD